MSLLTHATFMPRPSVFIENSSTKTVRAATNQTTHHHQDKTISTNNMFQY
jgi:hypothetical protein